MNSKALLSLMVIAPLLAEDAAQPVPAKKSEEIQQVAPAPAAQEAAQPVVTFEPWRIALVPATITIEYRLIKETKTIDKTAWKNCKKLLSDLEKLFRKKQFDQAGTLLDQINATKPEGVKGIIVLNAYAADKFMQAQMSYESTKIKGAGEGYGSQTIWQLNREEVKPETWREVTATVFDLIKTNQELPYDQAKQVVLSLVAKS
jgi:hypothetical protein